MKRHRNNEIGLYEYLEKEGVLQNANHSAILSIKKKYWSQYRREWNKLNRKSNKSFSLYFNSKQLNAIEEAAEKNNLKPTTFIKRSAIACSTNQNFINPVILGELRELLAKQINLLQRVNEERKVTLQFGNELLERMIRLEELANNYFIYRKSVKHIL